MQNKLVYLLIALILLGLSSPVQAQPLPGNFVDIKGHWAEQDIQAAYNLGLMSGTGVNSQGGKIFEPEATATHAQLAVLLQQVFQLDYGKMRFIKQPMASDYYSDVDNGTWYSDAVVMCAINQIFTSQGKFKPSEPVTRIELARAVVRSFKAKEINVPTIEVFPIYKDTQNLTQEDVNAVTFVSNAGIMNGNEGCFMPDQSVKRAELAKVMLRCTSLMVIDETSNGKEITVPAGKSLVISLAGNPTTGYTWDLADAGDKDLISLTGQIYQPGSNPQLAGQGGRDYFKFKALKPGSTTIKLNYERPWESVQPPQTFKLKVTVQP